MVSIYIGLLFIAIAVAVKFYPGLLAGYNSLSNREKENAQANGLPMFASILFGAMGVISIAGYFVGIWLNKPSISGAILGIGTFAGVIILIVFGNILINKSAR